MVLFFGYHFGSVKWGTTKWNPTVCSISLSPIFGNQKSTRFPEPTFVFWKPFFRFRSFWNGLLAANRTTWNNWLCFPFPLAASGITSSCYSDGVLPPPLSSSQPLVACWHMVGVLQLSETFYMSTWASTLPSKWPEIYGSLSQCVKVFQFLRL